VEAYFEYASDFAFLFSLCLWHFASGCFLRFLKAFLEKSGLFRCFFGIFICEFVSLSRFGDGSIAFFLVFGLISIDIR
jgi:hypothetical protein